LKAALALRDDITRLTEMVEHLRSVRSQLKQHNDLLKDHAKAEPLVKQANELVEKLDALEAKLHNPKAEAVYDILAQKGGAKLYSKMISLYDAINDSDGPPTQGFREEYVAEVEELKGYEKEFKGLMTGDVTKLNELAKKLDVPGVIVPEGKK
jgi:hypothetical protein